MLLSLCTSVEFKSFRTCGYHGRILRSGPYMQVEDYMMCTTSDHQKTTERLLQIYLIIKYLKLKTSIHNSRNYTATFLFFQ